MYQNKTSRLIFSIALSLAITASCGNQQMPVVNPDAPTVDTYPELTNEATVTITGTRSANTTIWYQKTGESTAVRGAEASPDTTWSIQIPLNEGTNKVAITASNQDETLFSSAVNITVELDTVPPSPPVVESPPTTLSLGDNPSQVSTLRGTKDANSSLILDGTTVVEVEAGMTWQQDVDIVLGINSFEFRSADLAGNVSGAATVEIIAVSGTGVVSDPWFAPPLDETTSVTTLDITGRKSVETSIWLEHQGVTPATEIMSVNDETSWSHTVELVEGENIISIYSTNIDGAQSNVASDTIVLDTTAPSPPALDSVDESTGQSSVTITGTRDEDGNVCFRSGVEPNCTEVVSRESDGTSFSHTVALVDGDNYLCFSSSDAIGNGSDEVCVSIIKLIGPTVTIESPESGTVVSTASVSVEATALGTDDPGGNVASVQICFDQGQPATEDCNASPSSSGDTYATTFDTSGLDNGSVHVISVTATNGVGVETTATTQVIYQNGILMLSDTGAPRDAKYVAMIEDHSGTLHVIWRDACMASSNDCQASQPGNDPEDILHRSFGPDGWSDFTLISDGEGDPNQDGQADSLDAVLDSNGLLHIVWADTGVTGGANEWDIFHRTLDPNTNALGPISTFGPIEKDRHPALAAASDGSIHLVWKRSSLTNDDDWDVYYARWDATAGWGEELLVTDHINDGNSNAPQIAIDSNDDPHIVWQEDGDILENGNTDQDIYYRSIIGGVMTDYVLLTNVYSDNFYRGDSVGPDIAINADDVVYVAWRDETNAFGTGPDSDIFLHTLSNGQIREDDQDTYHYFNGSDFDSDNPVLVLLDCGGVLLTWAEKNAEGNSDIAYIRLYDVSGLPPSLTETDPQNIQCGADKEVGMQITSVTGGTSSSPAVAVSSSGTIHLAWHDDATLDPITDAEHSAEGPDDDIFYLAITP